MKIGMIGGGGVAQALAAKLLAVGHDVVIGIRSVSDAELDKDRMMAQPLRAWMAETGGRVVTMAEAAAHGEIVFNVTAGQQSIAALTVAGAANLAGKVLIDVANPLDFSMGMPPFLAPELSVTTSLGEEIQKAFPHVHVVKAFNTVSNRIMVEPSLIPGDHDLLIAGNSAAAKATVSALARDAFGWKSIRDMGDIVGARATEHLLPLWVRMWMLGGNPLVNVHLVEG
ncbi:MAG: NADPH-dependent F420 reductase [Paracoccaceae bacterium]